jgi:hypothetical protein
MPSKNYIQFIDSLFYPIILKRSVLTYFIQVFYPNYLYKKTIMKN